MLEWRAVTSFNPIWAATGSPSRKPLEIFLIIVKSFLSRHQLGLLIVSTCTSSAMVHTRVLTMKSEDPNKWGGVWDYYTEGGWEVGITLSPKRI